MISARRSVGAPWPVPTKESTALYRRAADALVGGVQGDARYVDPHPLYMTYGKGAHVRDADGTEYLDFHSAFGSVLLGHNAEPVYQAVKRALATNGVTFGACHPWEVELAELLTKVVPCAERVVFSCVGSEVTFHAVRLARAATGRRLILKAEGNYHGWTDALLLSTYVPPGSGGPRERPVPVAGSAGMAPGASDAVLVREYNDRAALRDTMAQHGSDIAAVIVEPIYYNGGVVVPDPGYLEDCRTLCTRYGAVLIFDEILTGWREGLGGAQGALAVTPDLATFGKALANGFALSALAGRRDLMEHLTPLGPAFFSGTHCGHMLNVTAGLASLRTLIENPPYDHLRRLGELLQTGIDEAIAELGVRAQIRQRAGVWALYFTSEPIRNHRDVIAATGGRNADLRAAYLRWLARSGIYLHPWFILRGFLTAAHTETDVANLITATTSFLRHHRADLATE